MGVENNIFCSEGVDKGGTPKPRIPRGTPFPGVEKKEGN